MQFFNTTDTNIIYKGYTEYEKYQLTGRTTAPPPVATTFLGAKDNFCNASLCKEKMRNH